MNPSSSLPQTSSPPSDGVDTAPLLTYSISDHLLRSRRILRRRPPPLPGAAARILRRASGRRLMLREPSVRVRETAAEQLEERQSDWAYSKPVIVLDIIWNSAFVVMAVVVLALSREEKPTVHLRLWVSGYGLQCLFHVACVVAEYKIRNERRVPGLQNDEDPGSALSSQSGSETEEMNSGDETRVAKSLESANTMFSFLWWITGFYWITAKEQALTHHSPQLYWLCVTFLALDMVFVFICVAVACLIGLAVCCCLPCIIAILYTLTDRDGATDEEIDRLPKYKFRKIGDIEKVEAETQESHEGIMTECNADTPTERILPHEDAECCICLSAYEVGTELRELPCHHHFHCNCIDKWLYINATCPLCKFNILKAGEEV
ncbi:hypothetical protein like AT3G61180 [Hibiscus trionum]|uniref:RING-type E3 ubiquitin transferase n=1 Tax=Hibiscus trionum TaxID=183268 RepID=A0A9W7IMF8_HIBTR|nr:hypothetical protein like AT3G61180 [Hibiscus trionum]